MTDFARTRFGPLNARTQDYIMGFIDAARQSALIETNIDTTSLPGFIKKCVGKVRDMYICEEFVVLVTTDRQSAFDRQLTAIPFKGQVLNLSSLWWFEQTKHIVPNHLLASPHPNVTIGKRCTVFPVEFVMRGYLTGSTSTSIWTHYSQGQRFYCGHSLPEGLVKNAALPTPLLTPTTKSDEHDELISADEILSRHIMSAKDLAVCSSYALALFSLGQSLALEKGLLLVDTKYEFGKDSSGNIVVVDEIHTPDSSRYWVAETYEERMRAKEVGVYTRVLWYFSHTYLTVCFYHYAYPSIPSSSIYFAQEPDNIDKEFLRRWYVGQCDPYTTPDLPVAPPHLVNELARRYVHMHAWLTLHVVHIVFCCTRVSTLH